ncbi:MAG: GIY-YIG nuclease family protein [Candidatus Omnitrophica bacterium]|nr:GIY-YIG nuclease family protein [Candidatus Omnitrophota bacterium]
MNRMYFPLIDKNAEINCCTKCIVYVITCKKCGMQYVGQTIRKLKDRVLEHRRSILNGTMVTYLAMHFREINHSIDDFRVMIAEVVNGNNSLQTRELFWIKLLNTAYPFGLNDNIASYGNISEGITPFNRIGHPYFSLPFAMRKRSKFQKKHRRSKQENKDIIEHIKAIFISDRFGKNNMMFNYLKQQSQKTLAFCHKYTAQCNQDCDPMLKLALMAFLAGYYKHLEKEKFASCAVDRIFIPFLCPAMDSLCLKSLFMATSVKKLSPLLRKDQRKIQIVFNYSEPFSRKVFNYNKALRDTDTLVKLKRILCTSCSCENSRFVYSPAGHIITGNLAIVENKLLRNILRKGTKYRLPKTCTQMMLQNTIGLSINALTNSLANRTRIPFSRFVPWYMEILRILDTRVKKLMVEHALQAYTDGLSLALSYLDYLQQHFIIAPADKAGGNFVFTCKKYYFQVMSIELGIERVGADLHLLGNRVYNACTGDISDIIKKHIRMTNHFGLKLDEKDKVLPLIFAIPKLHKNPYKYRFIAGAKRATTRKISRTLHLILVHMKVHFQNYCAKILLRSGRRCFWSVESSEMALHRLAHVGRVSNILTADFATLFTKLPHTTIQHYIFRLVSLCFKSACKRYIAVGYKVFYTDEIKSSHFKFYDESQVKLMIETVLDETYIVFAGSLFRQICGIPMGGNASPMLADLCLAFMEFEYAKNPNNDRIVALRFIDDLLVLNYPDFLAIARHIYGSDLDLEVTYAGDYCNFLDLAIQVNPMEALETSVYNKTDSFPFNVMRYSYPDSNVSVKVHSATIFGQLLRYLRISSSYNGFISKARELFQTFESRGFGRDFLIDQFLSFCKRNEVMFLKYHMISDKVTVHMTFSIFGL